MLSIIDPHLHLFDLKLGDYGWLKPQHPPTWPDKNVIARDVNEGELALNSPLSMAGFVHIEAGFDNQRPWREIEWLESHCQFPFKSVACCDLLQLPSNFLVNVNKLTKFESVVGVRHILDDDAVEILSQSQTLQNLTHLAQLDLLFELQFSVMDDDALDLLVQIKRQLPALTLVINHGGFPPYCDSQDSQSWRKWQDGLIRLAAFDNCFVKASGFEMFNRQYSKTFQQGVIRALVESFGLDRVMLASNFPLCTFTTTYQDYWQNILSHDIAVQRALYLDNAKRIYRFS